MSTIFPPLNEREQLILEAVVHLYITTAEPVGSRTVAKRLGLNLSSATIRNVMADLEDLGYLTQVHTSSGRVPTDLGYKYYVKHLMKIQELTLAERERIRQELTRKLDSAEQILRRTSHLLALATHQAGLADMSGEGTAEIRRIELIHLFEKQIAILIVDSFGNVHTSSVTVEEPISSALLDSMSKFLNESLANVPLENMHSVIKETLRKFFDERHRLAELALRILGKVEPTTSQMFLEGTTNLFDQPEFQEPNKARSIFGIIENPEPIIKMLREKVAKQELEERTVLIGSDTKIKELDDFGLIASPYRLEDTKEPIGFVGVLGPKRMPYEKLTAIVDYTASMVGKMFSRLWR